MKFKCCICGKSVDEWGNNPFPVREKGECCDRCNENVVLPARIMAVLGGTKKCTQQKK